MFGTCIKADIIIADNFRKKFINILGQADLDEKFTHNNVGMFYRNGCMQRM